MVSSCANPECGAPFLYFGSGRLYVFEPDEDSDFRVESYWLCGKCAARLTLVRNIVKDGIQLVGIDNTDTFPRKAIAPSANKLR